MLLRAAIAKLDNCTIIKVSGRVDKVAVWQSFPMSVWPGSAFLLDMERAAALYIICFPSHRESETVAEMQVITTDWKLSRNKLIGRSKVGS